MTSLVNKMGSGKVPQCNCTFQRVLVNFISLASGMLAQQFYSPQIMCLKMFSVYSTCVSGTFDGGFNLAAWRFCLNYQTKVTANIIFKRTLW